MIGKITSISEIKKDINNNDFMFFDIVQNEYIDDNLYNSSFYKIRLYNNLIKRYQSVLFKGKNIYVSGYLNSYKKDSKVIYYIYPLEIKELDNNYTLDESSSPTISYDPDGVMVWNGKRCESTMCTPEEQKEMEALLSEYQ